MRPLLGLLFAFATAASAQVDTPVAAPPPNVDLIRVEKAAHRMIVFKDGAPIRTFQVALGQGGLPPKTRRGDNRVPEGRYTIAGRNPASAFYLSLRISYPNADDIAAAQARGVDPGGDIMIHGLPNGKQWIGERHRRFDWTAGCIALTDDEIYWLWQAVPDGTPIEIDP